jgi:hypothetical protein
MGITTAKTDICDSANSEQAWWEASTKGAILILASSETQRLSLDRLHLSPAVSATIGGIAGGAAQSYFVMGMTTCMKTIEVTRSKTVAAGERVPGTMEVFANLLRTRGIRGINKGSVHDLASETLVDCIVQA